MSNQKKKKSSKIVRIIKKIFILLIIFIVIALGIIAGYAYNLWSQIDHDSDFDKSQIEINEGVSTKGYYNILLFGVDARNQQNSYEGSLSDVIMVVSINQDTKKIKIASVYRDTYLQITGKSFDKVTHAFKSGGPALSMSTINTNLDLDITDYVAINFNVVVDVVDAVGGVTLDITRRRGKIYKSIYRRSK